MYLKNCLQGLICFLFFPPSGMSCFSTAAKKKRENCLLSLVLRTLLAHKNTTVVHNHLFRPHVAVSMQLEPSEVGSRMQLRRVAQSFSCRFKGKTVAFPMVRSEPPKKNENRVVDAEVIHGDEQVFWSERRTFQRRYYPPYMPSWDRFAQTLILMARTVPRVPQEAAFRLLAVFLKLLLIGRLTDLAQMMLPSWMSVNVQGLLPAPGTETSSAGKPERKD